MEMKIFMLCDVWLDGRDAQTTHVLELFKNLGKLRDTHLFAPRPKKLVNEAQNTIFVPTVMPIFKSAFYQLFLFLYLIYYCFKLSPDVIYGRLSNLSFSFFFISKIFRIPYVIEVNGLLIDEEKMIGRPKVLTRLTRLNEKHNYKQADKIVAVTQGIKDGIKELHSIPDEKIVVIPNGANTDLFKPMHQVKAKKRIKIRRNKPLHATVLSIFFMATLILTHTVTAMCMAIILFVCWAVFNPYNTLFSKTEIPISLTISLLFTTAMFGWWTYASGHITTLANLIKWGFSIDFFVHTPKEISKYLATVPVPEQIFNNVGMFLFFSLSFVGIFYMISKKGNSLGFAAALAGFTPLALGFFSLITGHSIIEHRWWYFSQILLAIPLAVAIILIGMWNGRSSRFVSIFSFVFVVPLTFLMIMSPPANVDNHVFSPNSGVRYAYTESEMDAASFFAQNLVETISADWDYQNVLSLYYHHDKVHLLDESFYTKNFLHEGSIKIIRREIVNNRPFRLLAALYRLDYNPNIILTNSGFNKIYDCCTVNRYL